MILFLLKGLLRDRSRSLFPLITVIIGVMLTVFLFCWIKGYEIEIINVNASFSTGHAKVMTRAYAAESDQMPNDLALVGLAEVTQNLQQDFPEMIWTPRIKFGGLLDIPDSTGETRVQGPVAGIAVDLRNPASPETTILNLKEAIIRGRLPEAPNEILISDEFARRLGIVPGETATLISSTMYGSMATANFNIAGTIRFGVSAMDRGAVVIDVHDLQLALDMENATGEVLGFYPDFIYRNEAIERVVDEFNRKYQTEDLFSPSMISLRNQMGLAQTLDFAAYFSKILIVIFVLVMSIVLWNAGLMGSLRRYGEIGVRLAIGEDKGHIYRSMLAESLMIGFFGSIFGTLVGLTVAYYIQVHGINISSMMKNASLIISDVIRTHVTPASYFIGFVPGFLATLLGTSISGIGIYKRQTSQLAKELEA